MAQTMKEMLAAKKLKAAGGAAVVKKPAAKVVAPVAEEEEGAEETTEEGAEEGAEGGEEQTEGGEEAGGEEEQAEETVAAAPKKIVGKVVTKPVVKAAAPAAKVVTKPVAKAVVAAKPAAKAAAPAAKAPAKKAGWTPKGEQKEARELKPCAWMPQDLFIDKLHADLEALGIAPPTKAMTTAIFKQLEATMYEVLQVNDLKFLGVKFRRVEMGSRVYAPNPGLDKVATPYHTLVSPHTKVSLSLYFDKSVERGAVDEDGTFVSGQFNEDGSEFTLGTWEGDVFTPTVAVAAKPKAKIGKK